MPNNPAFRIAKIFERARQEPDTTSALNVWAHELLIDALDDIDTYEVVTLINTIAKECRKIESALQRTEIPEQLYQRHLEEIYRITEVKNLTSNWKHVKDRISNEVLLFLYQAAYVLESDEPAFEKQEIEKISEQLAQLVATLDNELVSPQLKDFIQEQIRLIEMSLAKFEIQGASALKKCYVEGLGEIIQNSEVIKSNQDQPPVVKLRETWATVQTATTKAATANKTIDTWSKVIDRGSSLIDGLLKLGGGA